MPLLSDPGMVSRDPSLAWKTSLWFWMNRDGIKPSCSDALAGRASPDGGNRQPGFGWVSGVG